MKPKEIEALKQYINKRFGWIFGWFIYSLLAWMIIIIIVSDDDSNSMYPNGNGILETIITIFTPPVLLISILVLNKSILNLRTKSERRQLNLQKIIAENDRRDRELGLID